MLAERRFPRKPNREPRTPTQQISRISPARRADVIDGAGARDPSSAETVSAVFGRALQPTWRTRVETAARVPAATAVPGRDCARRWKWQSGGRRAAQPTGSRSRSAPDRQPHCTRRRAAWPLETHSRSRQWNRSRRPPGRRRLDPWVRSTAPPSESSPRARVAGRCRSRSAPPRAPQRPPRAGPQSWIHPPSPHRPPGTAGLPASGRWETD